MYNERLGKLALLADVHLLQRHVLPAALHRHAGHAAARLDYDEKFARLEHLHHARGLRARAPSTLIFVYNAIISWWRGEPAPANPWRSLTIEWQVSSPPPIFNFDGAPRVVGGPYNYGQPGREARRLRRGARGGGTQTIDAGMRRTRHRERARRSTTSRPAAGLRQRRAHRSRRCVGLIIFLASGDHALRRVLHGVLLRPLHELPGVSAASRSRCRSTRRRSTRRS